LGLVASSDFALSESFSTGPLDYILVGELEFGAELLLVGFF